MTLPQNAQYLRKVSLLLVKGDKALDLSAFKITFRTSQADNSAPNNCEICVYNLSDDTMRSVPKEFSEVVLSAGYENGNFGLIFKGTVRWYQIRKPSPKDSMLVIQASDGEYAYNNAVVNESLGGNPSITDRLNAIMSGFKKWNVDIGFNGIPGDAIALKRGKVQFGLARTALSALTRTVGCTWSIQNGKINILPLDGYLPGEAVVLNRNTGLIGRPEQMAEGIRGKCLLNPRLTPGGLIQIDNKAINQATPGPGNSANLTYNSYKQTQYLPDVTLDGFYRLYVVEVVGDSRGQDWYCDFVALSVNALTFKVKPYG